MSRGIKKKSIKDDALFLQGDPADDLFLIKGGRIKLSTVLEDTLTCGFSRGQFEELVLQHPKVGLQIINPLSERISSLTDRVGSLAVANIEDRLYRVLTNVAKEHGAKSSKGVVIQFPLIHEDLGFFSRRP